MGLVGLMGPNLRDPPDLSCLSGGSAPSHAFARRFEKRLLKHFDQLARAEAVHHLRLRDAIAESLALRVARDRQRFEKDGRDVRAADLDGLHGRPFSNLITIRLNMNLPML
jgi:hypothetical protein